MIIFNGIAFESVAPVRIEDIRVSPIEQNAINRPRAINAGADFVRMRYGARTVSITFALQNDNRDARQSALLNVSQWAKSDREYMLELPNYPGMYLQAVCTGKPEPSYRQWWESKLRLVFTAYDNPFWNSKGERRVACGTAFFALGDAPPLMRIERTLDAESLNQSYSLDGDTMTFGSIPAGNLVIDLTRQTAAVNGTSIMGSYAVASRFIVPRTGLQTITGTGTVVFRERWQ